MVKCWSYLFCLILLRLRGLDWVILSVWPDGILLILLVVYRLDRAGIVSMGSVQQLSCNAGSAL